MVDTLTDEQARSGLQRTAASYLLLARLEERRAELGLDPPEQRAG
jgi:hypothetical protein